MSCIHCYSSPLHLTLQKHRQNAKHTTKFFGTSLSTKKYRHSSDVILQVGVFPSKLETLSHFTLAVAKPADTSVLIQTSALLIFVYLIANFVVPQFLSKSFELDKADENEKGNNDTTDEQKASSTAGKSGSNSTKPK